MKRIFIVLMSFIMTCSFGIIVSAAEYKGDVNRDGKVAVDDALLVLEFSVGKNISVEKKYADMDKNGLINSSDSLEILFVSVGKREKEFIDGYIPQESKEELRRKEIDEENLYYKNEVEEIKAKYESKIDSYRTTVRNGMRELGIVNLYSPSYYQNMSNTLNSEINTLNQRLAYLSRDTTGRNQAEISSINKQISEKRNELTSVLTALQLAKMGEAADDLEEEMNIKLDFAEEVHMEVLKQIDKKYK